MLHKLKVIKYIEVFCSPSPSTPSALPALATPATPTATPR